MAKRIAVVLAGCGNKDGSEITEAVSVLLALSEAQAEYRIFAPDMEFEAKNFLTEQPTHEFRNVLRESARIARGEIQPLAELKTADFDGLVIPGGAGAYANLSNSEGAARLLKEFHAAEKPICAICIAPKWVAQVLGAKGITITLGQDPTEVENTGAHFEPCAVDDFVTDRDHRIITTPAYMYADAKPFEVYTGIRKAVRELVEMS